MEGILRTVFRKVTTAHLDFNQTAHLDLCDSSSGFLRPVILVSKLFFFSLCFFRQQGQFSNPETPGYVGFANLPNQVHRKSVKKGFEFTLMVVGEYDGFVLRRRRVLLDDGVPSVDSHK